VTLLTPAQRDALVRDEGRCPFQDFALVSTDPPRFRLLASRAPLRPAPNPAQKALPL